MHLLLAAPLAVLATSTFAHEIPAPGWDKYAGERDTAHDALPMEHTDMHAREAVGYPESDAMQAWEEAHIGQPMEYEAFDREGGDGALLTRDDTQLSAQHGEDSVEGLAKDRNAPISAHGLPDFGDADVDTSLEGYDHVLAHSMMSTNEDDADALGSPLEVRDEFVRWTGILPTTEMHFPPSPTRRPSIPSSDRYRSQHSVRDVSGMWWEDLKGGVRHVLDLR
ncbi:hypothetical protein LTR87_007254 [Friedmanniomyces endolithicus]|nr:hypothetical protein LTR87_007254 [Friedmanniomyces endolithicus]